MSGIWSLFSVEALDARFAPQNQSSAKETSTRSIKSKPAKWHTREFYVYAIVFIIVVPYMFWVTYDVSRPSHPNYPLYEPLLSNGWIPGRKVDNSDQQYQNFRDNVPILLGVVALHQALRRIIPISRIYFDALFAAIFLSALHGVSFLKMVLILAINYGTAKTLGGNPIQPILTWVFNIGILLLNEWFRGYQFGSLHPSMIALDAFTGIVPRWEVSFNITMLRLVSFNMDYYWSTNGDTKLDVSA